MFYCTKWLQVIIRLLSGATFSSGNTDNSILADRRERSRECSVLCMSLCCTIRVLHSDTVLSLLQETSCCRDASTSASITLDSVPLPLYILPKQETNLVPYRYERNGTADEVVTFKVAALLSNDYFFLCAHLWALLCRACSYVKLNNKWGVANDTKLCIPTQKYKALRLGEHGGHAAGPAVLLHWSCQLSLRTPRTRWPNTNTLPLLPVSTWELCNLKKMGNFLTDCTFL